MKPVRLKHLAGFPSLSAYRVRKVPSTGKVEKAISGVVGFSKSTIDSPLLLERTPLMPRWQAYAIVGLISAIVVLTNLGGPRLWDRDEPRNAGCAAEMLARGDWVVPVFNSELRTHK